MIQAGLEKTINGASALTGALNSVTAAEQAGLDTLLASTFIMPVHLRVDLLDGYEI